MASYRPNLHFTASKGWINDPNGLVYRNGWYHLFYQYHPHSTVWGPMHWGHAVSRDLFRWRTLPIAIRPGEQGAAFSGSAVVDVDNRSGLGRGRLPMVLCYTQHGSVEQQGLCISRRGIFFRPYKDNPVIENPGIPDFRDPKVFRMPEEDCWRMVLTAGDRLYFYRAEDLRTWEKTGEFMPQGDIPYGVLECPDLFPLESPDGERIWVLLVSVAMAPEQGGSRTLYFLGDFVQGQFTFRPGLQASAWLDEGMDCYAGVTYNNIPGGRRILIGWQNNWAYADKIPTNGYRGALTLPRELRLDRIGEQLVLIQQPVRELMRYHGPFVAYEFQTDREGCLPLPGSSFELTLHSEVPYNGRLENESGERLTFGLDGEGRYYIDRSIAGYTDFSPYFYPKMEAPRVADEGQYELRLIFDVQTLEMFFDGGKQVMSAQVFPKEPFTQLRITGGTRGTIYQLR